jgi:hypothetical protein
MTKVEKLEHEIASLSEKELTEFRLWYAEFDAATWDREIEADSRAGALAQFADEALAEHHAGRSAPALKHHASPRFWQCYEALPGRVRALPDKSFEFLDADPAHHRSVSITSAVSDRFA